MLIKVPHALSCNKPPEGVFFRRRHLRVQEPRRWHIGAQSDRKQNIYAAFQHNGGKSLVCFASDRVLLKRCSLKVSSCFLEVVLHVHGRITCFLLCVAPYRNNWKFEVSRYLPINDFCCWCSTPNMWVDVIPAKSRIYSTNANDDLLYLYVTWE